MTREKGMLMNPSPLTHRDLDAMDCPKPVTWTDDIKKMFTSVDIEHMMHHQNIHLDSYTSVKIWAPKIYSYVKNGIMPPPGTIGPDGKPELPWDDAKVSTFGCWIKQGCPEGGPGV
jgi:hypothetical protein